MAFYLKIKDYKLCNCTVNKFSRYYCKIDHIACVYIQYLRVFRSSTVAMTSSSCPAETWTAAWRFLLSQSVKRGVVKRAAPAKMAAELHPRSGKLIGLSNSNRTAQRNQPVQEFNHGLVLSREPLRDRDVFTVRIDKKVNKSACLIRLR